VITKERCSQGKTPQKPDQKKAALKKKGKRLYACLFPRLSTTKERLSETDSKKSLSIEGLLLKVLQKKGKRLYACLFPLLSTTKERLPETDSKKDRSIEGLLLKVFQKSPLKGRLSSKKTPQQNPPLSQKSP